MWDVKTLVGARYNKGNNSGFSNSPESCMHALCDNTQIYDAENTQPYGHKCMIWGKKPVEITCDDE
jgi:hypothetical protein